MSERREVQGGMAENSKQTEKAAVCTHFPDTCSSAALALCRGAVSTDPPCLPAYRERQHAWQDRSVSKPKG